ncbi:MAG: hypothetical protein RLZZ383_2599, partial [Pseudomonadota bacterium]
HEGARAPPPAHGTPAVVVAPHHGSRAGTASLRDAVGGARWVWVSVGADNPYGHPSAEVAEVAWRARTPILRTDTHGALVLHVGPDGVPDVAWWPSGHGGWLKADAAQRAAE